jgi:hypothetical protein
MPPTGTGEGLSVKPVTAMRRHQKVPIGKAPNLDDRNQKVFYHELKVKIHPQSQTEQRFLRTKERDIRQQVRRHVANNRRINIMEIQCRFSLIAFFS